MSLSSFGAEVRSRHVQEYLDDHLPREPGTKIQYGHPSPRFWHEPAARVRELLTPLDEGKPLSLYVHIPFCPPTTPEACGFCLFARQDLRSYETVSAYLVNLRRELEHYRELIGRRTIRALYFGGGTPNILTPADIESLIVLVRRLFATTGSTEVTFEGTPALFTAGRLEALYANGVNRISIGAQTLDPRLIAHSGRKQAAAHVREAVRFCRDRGMRCSVDLITGWFGQSPEHVLADVKLLTQWGVTGIVNHPLTLAGDSEFARKRRELPPVETTCRSFLAAREWLLSNGYRADSYTDYCRVDLPPVEYLESYRDVLNNDRIGVGYGANSVLSGTLENPGHTYRNVAGLGPYAESSRKLANGGHCVESMFRFSALDLRLLYVMKGLEGAPHLTAEAYGRVFGSELRQDFEAWWEALEQRGWLVWDNGSPRLVNEGVFYTSTVQRCVAEPRNVALRGRCELTAESPR